ncbi:MAG: phosphomannomutase [Tabrizicola sp.]|uniref:phosphomannomutase n=1 Tax=Tabrizicola sp. TaxID=2005166 RepID=UPI0027362F80|nr:phosphomannomutase [Tabrizicola sp.]MDP3265169.1 phosphomannomutase [Tabrizicola sp.]MDP3646937.1 phosphomannomutase [Paracoccaceae bacterium]MDZ4069237.1 phosphomannomutase [Tabrizicola sp.]
MGLTAFKAYDVRGRLGEELNEDIVRRIARAFAEVTGTTRVVLGRDCRESSELLAGAVVEGLLAAGVEVLDLGLAGTEEMYFATSHLQAGGGITVTASHNPMDYNGLKLVGAGSVPLAQAGFDAVKALAESERFAAARPGGRVVAVPAVRSAYVDRVLGFVDVGALRPLKILVNCGNGAAGPTFDALAEGLAAKGAPLQFERMFHDPDGSFPNGIPNPLLEANQPVTADAVRAVGADMGVAFDGDFDRCFLFDATGAFVPGEYVVGLLAEAFLAKEPGAAVIHDPRVIWNTQDLVARAGGRAVMARTGHVFLKRAMRETGAVYGGEMSAHHYFRDFMCCDSGMIPWLLVAELMGRTGRPLAGLLAEMRAAFPSSGEINFRVGDARAAVARVEAALAGRAVARDDTDGMSLDFGDWRLNLRSSNTEPLLRLNVEARGDAALVEAGVALVRRLIEG